MNSGTGKNITDSLELLTVKQLVFIDSQVENHQFLASKTIPGVEVTILQKDYDGIAQISEVLQSQSQVSNVHIVSHGSPGCLHLGNSQLSLDTLDSYTRDLKTWFSNSFFISHLSSLMIYGCNVAAGDAGEEFIAKLHDITGAKIAASTTKVGYVALGGNWNLDVKTQDFEVVLPFKAEILESYQSVFVITVTNTNDSGAGSLRQAVANSVANAANGVGEKIEFAPSIAGQTIQLTSGAIEILADVEITIDGSTAPGVIVDGGWDGQTGIPTGTPNSGADRIFFLPSSNTQTLNLNDFTLQDAHAGDVNSGANDNEPKSTGGAIYLELGEINLTNMTLDNNFGHDGGAIKVQRGTLNAQNTTFSNNKARDDGGAIDIASGTTATLTNVTLANNEGGSGLNNGSSARGGAARVNGIMNLNHVTVAFNIAQEGGAFQVGSSGTLNVQNSLILNNSDDANKAFVGDQNDVNDLGNNWEDSASVSDGRFGFANDVSAADADFQTLQDNGGPTQTVALGPDTVLRNAITTNTLNADQRYYIRGLDVPATGFTSDIEPGAYELNVAPVSDNDSETTTLNQPVTINVLSNDLDPDAIFDPTNNDLDESTVTIVTQPSNGNVSVDPVTGEVTYTPNNNYTGADSFTYTVKDLDGMTSNPATVDITVNNLVPVANPDTNTATEGGSDVSDNVINNATTGDTPGDEPTNVTSANQNGTAITLGTPFTTTNAGSLTLNSDGSYDYTPPAQGQVPPSGLTEIFNYTITDVNGDTSSTTLTINVANNNLTPTANADTNTATEAGTVVSDNVITANDTLGDGNTTVTAANQGGNVITIGEAFTTEGGGSLTLNSDGSYNYIPPAQGDVPTGGLVEVFNYTITDEDGDNSSTTLTINVANNNLTPVANPDTNSATEAGTLISDNVITANDTPGDGNTTVTAATQGGNVITIGEAFATEGGGSITLNSDGSYNYIPPAQGEVPPSGLVETFNYTITDADGDTSSTTLTINVADNNTPPTVDLNGSDPGEDYSTIFSQGSAGVAIADPTTIVTDDSGNLTNATITLTNFQMGDVLDTSALPTGTGINVNPSSTATNILLTGTGTIAEYQAAIAAITFSNSETLPDRSDRTIEVVVDDGTSPSNTATTTIQWDTDGDRVADSRDIDDDNDGIIDINEMQLSVVNPSNLGTTTVVDGGTPATQVYTNFDGFWQSSDTNPNSVKPNASHELLGFTSGGVTYTTGVADDNVIDSDSNGLFDGIDSTGDGNADLTAQEGDWQAVPPAFDVTGKVIVEGRANDGDVTQALNPTLVNSTNDVENAYLTNGERGLDLGTVLANINATWYFKVPELKAEAINDGSPDILLTQLAQPNNVSNIITFYDASGDAIGNSVRVLGYDGGALTTQVGEWESDQYPNNSLDTKPIRLATVELSEFGLTASNVNNIDFVGIEIGSATDWGFLAFNNQAFGSLYEDKDSDNDGIVDRLDIDADDDGIPDNIEAQTTSGYIAPSESPASDGFIDLDSDGLDDRYDADTNNIDYSVSEGLIPVDTDSDTTADYLDADSDNDGIDDINEAGHTSIALGTDTDGDGLNDTFETKSSSTITDGFDVNDAINDPNPSILPDSDNDVAADGSGATPLTADLDYRDIEASPIATNDTQLGTTGEVITVDVLANDSNEGITDPANMTVQLLNSSNEPVDSLTVAGEGTWTVQPNGEISFTPDASFTGDPTAVSYQITDLDGQTSTPAIVTITYQDAPIATSDTQLGTTGEVITVDVLANDSNEGITDPANMTVQLLDSSNNPVTTLSVAGEGTWAVQPNGEISFTPDASFTGDPTAVNYQITDSDNQTSNAATVSVTYQDAPVANNDTQLGTTGEVVTIDVLANDSNEGITDPANMTVQLLNSSNEPVDSLTVAGEGTWTVQPNGEISFTPDASFTGDPTAVSYQITDLDGQTSTPAIVTITYQDAPIATSDTQLGTTGEVITVDVLANDSNEGITDPANMTVQLLDSSNNPVNTLSVAGEGTWTVQPNGEISFTPNTSFTGDPTAVSYQITDLDGQTSTPATVTIIYPQPGSISGTVTSSDDGSGIGEVTISLLNLDNTPVTDGNGDPIVDTTQPDGSYQFTNVAPGNYKIQETNLPNYLDDSDSDGDNPNVVNVTISNGTNAIASFVDTPRSNVSGTVTSDNDSPLSGVEVGLFESDGVTAILDGNNQPLTAITGNNGIYTFTNIQPGDYTVIQTNLPGYADVSDSDGSTNGDSTIAVSFAPGEFANGNDFVDAPLSGSITGTVFSDIDDSGIQGVEVGLFESDGVTAVTDGGNPITALTGANGNYTFTNIQPGDYTVIQTNLPGYSDVSDSDGNANGDNTIAVSFAPGESSEGNDFTDIPLPQTISGSVTTSTSVGIGGVSLRLLDSNGFAVTNNNGRPVTATTEPDGSYSFPNIPIGEYTIVQTNLPGYKNISDSDGGNDNRVDVTLTPNNPATGNDFIDAPTISGRVWDDSDGNGLEGFFEDGLAGVSVTLTGAGANGIFGDGDDPADVIATTDSDGSYEFDTFNFDEQYQIAFDLPANLESEFTGFTTQDIAGNSKDRIDSDVDAGNLDGDNNPTTSITNTFIVPSGQAKGNIDAGLIKADQIDLTGTAGPDDLDGTPADEIIAGFKGQDTLTGGGGSDTFFMNETSEGVDIITDFDLTNDKIDFTQILDREVDNYSGTDPIADGYVVPTPIGSRGIMIKVNFDLDDGINPKSVVFLAGVTDADSFDVDNLIF